MICTSSAESLESLPCSPSAVIDILTSRRCHCVPADISLTLQQFLSKRYFFEQGKQQVKLLTAIKN